MRALRAATAGALLTMAMTGVASATEAGVPITIEHYDTSNMLDHSDQYGLRVLPPNGGPYQKWYVHSWGDNTREIKNAGSGKCMEVTSELLLTGKTCNASKYQSWYIITNGFRPYDYYALQNQQTGCTLDFHPSYGLRCIGYYGNRYQAWHVRDTG